MSRTFLVAPVDRTLGLWAPDEDVRIVLRILLFMNEKSEPAERLPENIVSEWSWQADADLQGWTGLLLEQMTEEELGKTHRFLLSIESLDDPALIGAFAEGGSPVYWGARVRTMAALILQMLSGEWSTDQQFQYLEWIDANPIK